MCGAAGMRVCLWAFVFNEMGGWQSRICNTFFNLAKVPMHQLARERSLIKKQLGLKHRKEYGSPLWVNKTNKRTLKRETCPINVSYFFIWRRKQRRKKKSSCPAVLKKKNLQRALIFFAERDRDRKSLNFHWNMFYVARSVFPLLPFSPSLSLYPFALTSGTNIVWQGPAVLFFVEPLPCWNDPTPHILWLLLKRRASSLSKKCGWYDTGTETAGQREKEERWGQTDRCGGLAAKRLSHLSIQKTRCTSGQEEVSISSCAYFPLEKQFDTCNY